MYSVRTDTNLPRFPVLFINHSPPSYFFPCDSTYCQLDAVHAYGVGLRRKLKISPSGGGDGIVLLTE